MARGELGRVKRPSQLTREILLAYPQGLFPMSPSAKSQEYQWYRPEFRGIMPINGFHASRSLRHFARKNGTKLTFHLNQNLATTMKRCGAREDTWISPPIITAFCELEELGLAYSLTVDLDGENIGGIYGLAMGRAFFGESMYSNSTNGSKLALWALVTHLSDHDFELFDTQYLTDHLASLGGEEIHALDYAQRLSNALNGWDNDDDMRLFAHASWRDLNSLINNRRLFVGTTINPDIISRMIHR